MFSFKREYINFYKLGGLNPALEPAVTTVYSNRIDIFMLFYVLLLKIGIIQSQKCCLSKQRLIAEHFISSYFVSLVNVKKPIKM